MKHSHPVLYVLIGTALSVMIACNDPTVIGEDLLAGDQLDIDFTDTISIHAFTQPEDSVQTFNADVFATNYQSFPVGEFIDPVLGKTRASAAFQVTLTGSSPDFGGATLDSIVLILPYRADRTYGKLNELYTIEVGELAETLNDSLDYYSNESFETKPNPLATWSYYPAPNDSVNVFSPREDKIVRMSPHLRVPLDDGFSQQFFAADSLNFISNDAFLNYFKGIQVKPTSENGGLVSFNLGLSNTGIRVYYHIDTSFFEYFFPVTSSSVVTASFENDYTGSVAAEFLGENSPLSDSLLFLQGMSGTNIVMEFPYAGSLEPLIVNKAEILLPVLFLPSDDPDYTPIEQIVVSQILDNGDLRLIDDILRSPSSRLTDIFGGVVGSDQTYRLNISSHFQDMIRGNVTQKILISAIVKPEQAGRVVIGGTRNPEGRARLNLTFTRY